MQKDVFDYNFSTKGLRMMILVSRTRFLRSRNPMMPFILPYDLDLWIIAFQDIFQFLMGKTLPNFNTR